MASTSLLETYQSSAHRHALEPAKPLCQLVELNLSFTHLGSADILALQSALRRGALPALRRIQIFRGVHRTLDIDGDMRRAMSTLQTACHRDPAKPILLDALYGGWGA